jgi:hypothetical protein
MKLIANFLCLGFAQREPGTNTGPAAAGNGASQVMLATIHV